MGSRPFRAAVYSLFAMGCNAASVLAQDTAKLGGTSGRRSVELEPTTRQADSATLNRSVDLGGWTYHAVKSPIPRDGVPWELVATPTEPMPDGWRRALGLEAAGFPLAMRVGEIDPTGKINSLVPMVDIPDVLWKQWMASDLQGVVGIHFHEVVADDLTRILLTLHKVPADPPRPLSLDVPSRPSSTSQPGQPHGTRIEATLLAPVTFCLDQAISVRQDPLRKELAPRRGAHELGHAEISQQVFFNVLAGPQDWNAQYCTGRHSRIEYYWKREKIGRTWEGYRRGAGELATLRTSVVLVPPTRWSMMLPVPPERVTQKQLQDFNDAIVRVSQRFVAVDGAAQEQFHAKNGAYDDAGGP